MEVRSASIKCIIQLLNSVHQTDWIILKPCTLYCLYVTRKWKSYLLLLHKKWMNPVCVAENSVAELLSSKKEFPESDVFVEAEDSKFFQCFMIISAAFILGYVAIVNKKKVCTRTKMWLPYFPVWKINLKILPKKICLVQAGLGNNMMEDKSNLGFNKQVLDSTEDLWALLWTSEGAFSWIILGIIYQ